jgi:transcriptional regulator of acetoin/glycerol metabolism
LSRFGGNVSQAAKALGLSRSALYRRLESNAQ